MQRWSAFREDLQDYSVVMPAIQLFEGCREIKENFGLGHQVYVPNNACQ